MHLKKKGILIVGIIAIFMISIGTFCLYKFFFPNIFFTRMIKDSTAQSKEEYYCEFLMMIMTKPSMIPIAPSIEDKIRELADWNNDVTTDMYEKYVAPLHITVSGKVKDGKTIFWYEGYVTTKKGDTIEYREEKTIDYVFAPEDEMWR